MSTDLTWSCILLGMRVGIPGLLGGYISALLDVLHHQFVDKDISTPSLRIRYKSWSKARKFWFFIGRSLMGLPGAFGIVLIGNWLGFDKVSFENDTEHIILLIGLSFMGGVFSTSLLPHIRDKIKKDLLNRMGKVEEEAQSAVNISKHTRKLYEDFIDFCDTLFFAQTALSRAETLNIDFDLEEACRRLQAIKNRAPTHRALHIYLGRIYRRLHDYDSAIFELHEFIRNLDDKEDAHNNEDIQRNIADTYYNIACYYCLKAQKLDEENPGKYQEKISELRIKAIDSLRLAINGNAENARIAKIDSDFNYFRKDIDDILPPDREE